MSKYSNENLRKYLTLCNGAFGSPLDYSPINLDEIEDANLFMVYDSLLRAAYDRKDHYSTFSSPYTQ